MVKIDPRWLRLEADARRRRRGVVHVYPVADLQEHVTDSLGYPWCGCAPRVSYEGEGILVVHNSYDGRELVEEHGVQ